MAYTSHEHWSLTLNGIPIVGLADIPDAVSFPEIDRVLTEYSAEGFILQALSGMKGGNVVITLQASSPSVKVLQEWQTAMVKGEIREIRGEARNSVWNIDCEMKGGVFKAGKSFIDFGSGVPRPQVYRISFQEILGNFSGATFPDAVAQRSVGNVGSPIQ